MSNILRRHPDHPAATRSAAATRATRRRLALIAFAAALHGAGCYEKTIKARGLGSDYAHPVIAEPDAPSSKSVIGVTEDF